MPLQGRGRGRYFPGKRAAAPAAESNRSAAWPRPWRHRPKCGPRRRDTGPCAAAFARFCGQCRAGRRRPERRGPAAGRRGSLPTPGGGADRHAPPRRDGPAHRPVGGADQRQPGGHGPAVCAGVERRGGAQRCPHGGSGPGRPGAREPHRQPRPFPWRAAHSTGALHCWPQRAHCAPGRAS